MDKALAELIKISNATGKDPTLVQGGGGNTSAKTADGKYMYIKASGTALKDMNAKQGWRRMCLDSVLAIVKDTSLTKLDAQKREVEVVNRLLLACDDNVTTLSRPSVEAHLHGLLNTYVIHLHPNTVGSYVNAKKGKAKLENLFKNEKFPPLWVPYVDPGLMLAKKIGKLVAGYKTEFKREPTILFLEKHGLFVTSNNANAALRTVRRVIRTCNSKLIQPKDVKIKPVDKKIINDIKLSVRKVVFQITGEYPTVTYFCDNEIIYFWRLKNAAKVLAAAALTPDELIYSNGAAMWVKKCDTESITKQVTRRINAGQRIPAAFLVKGVGLFVAGKKKVAQTVRDIAASFFFIRNNAYRLGGISSLSKRQQHFINNWESEAFRKKLATGTSEGMLKDRIAVVTGAGSGLGKSIALGLGRAGALVALADIDVPAAEKTSEIIKNELPEAQTLVLKCNVTDEASVDTGFDSVMENWGGLDILVNAAGIAPAFPLVELPVDKWRLALEINLTGYFLMARAAARIMIKQGIGGSIINLSSKSGLDASKNNTPYNATKAGELHMARGWALELGEHGIRVNCVCPGNVFEGSKIWNPDYIKVCAKKYGIKPEEVIPYYISKTTLKREIKGQDVADSVVFLCSDKARTITGQILVPDSGQVMVR